MMDKRTISAFFKSDSVRATARWLGVLAIVLAALVPLCRGRLPLSTDGTDHLYRIVELNEAIRQGVLWPRFAPDLAYGYGYPVFNYYAPPIYYLGVGLHWLGLDYVPALLVILGSSIILGALGTFKVTEAFFGPVAGYVAAAVYVFAPYTLMDLLAHSGAPEVLALAWLPWLLWSLHRVFAQPGALSGARLSLLYAALLFTHNITAVTGTVVLVIFLWFESVCAIRQAGLKSGLSRASLAAGALGLGLLIAAVFWLPAFLETRYVQIDHMAVDYRASFLTWSQLLPSPRPFDPQLDPTPVNMALGWPAAGLALVGGLAFYRQTSRALRGRVLTLLVALLGLVTMALPVSQIVWEHVSLLRLFQFPWRFIGPACVLAALLAGSAFGSAIQSGRWRVLPVAALLITMLYGLTWTWCRYLGPIIQPTRADIYTYEVTTNLVGTTAHREYLPVGVSEMPPQDRLAAQFAGNETVERLDRESLPGFVTVDSSTSAALSTQVAFTAAQPFTATFLWFYFPGWQAQLDGAPTALHASTPYGLIETAVPAGKHTVRVYFGSTPLRQLAGTLSGLGLLGLVGGVVWLRRLSAGKALAPQAEPRARPETNGRLVLLTLAGVGLGIAVLRLYLDTRDSVFRYTRYDGQRVTGAALDLDLNFGDEMNLIGVDRPAVIAADRPLPIVLYWRPYGEPSRNYSTSVRLVDAAGHLFGQQDVYQPGGIPTSVFVPENYVMDEHPLQAYAGTPPGEYRLVVSVYPEAGSGPALTVYDANHAPNGNSAEVARVTLTTPRNAPTDVQLNPQHLSGAQLGPLALVGYDLPITRANSGDDVPLTLYWRVVTPAPDTRIRMRLVGASGQVTPLGDFAPAEHPLPASAWKTGAGWRAPQQLLLPPTASSGPAALRLSLVDATGHALGEEVTLGTLDLTAPVRQFAVPQMSTSGDWRFGDALRLLGYDLPVPKLSPGSALPLTLYWQAEAVTTRRYVVFVHVLDSNRQIVAQADTPPLQGTRPTTSWLPGEVLTDPYTLTLPAELKTGEYAVEAGLYDAMTMERLAVISSGQPANNQVVLGTIRVEP